MGAEEIDSCLLLASLGESKIAEKELADKRRSSIESPWSWLVMLSSFFAHTMLYGVFWSTGVYYVVFLEEFHKDAGTTSWTGALQSAFVFFSGPIGSILTKRFGYRPVMILGTLIASIGLVVSMFATSIWYLFFTYGIIAGFGLGIAYIPTISAVAGHFDRHRTIAVGLACSGAGAGPFVYPRLIRFLIDTYGWRGSLLLVGAINTNVIVLAMFMLPSPIVVTEENSNRKLVKSNSHNLFNHHILVKKRYLLLCINQCLYFFGLSVVLCHLSSYAKFRLQVRDDSASAMLFSYMGFASFIGRIIYGGLGHHKKINIPITLSCSLLLGGVMVICMPLVQSHDGLTAVVMMYGLTISCLGTYLPDLVILYLDVHHFSLGYGCLLAYEGVGSLLGGPVAGWLYVWTGNYDISFYAAGTCMILAVLILIPTYSCMKPSAGDANATDVNDKIVDDLLAADGDEEHRRVAIEKEEIIYTGSFSRGFTDYV